MTSALNAPRGDVISLKISRIGTLPNFTVRVPLACTLKELREEIMKVASVGPLSFKLIMDDCTILPRSPNVTLLELGMADGNGLTMITESARDYGTILGPEKVLKTGQYPNGLVIDLKGNLYVSHFFGEIKIYDNNLKEVNHIKTFLHPRQLAFAPCGDLVVAFGSCVCVYEAGTLHLLRRFDKITGAKGVAVFGESLIVSTRNVIQEHRFDDGRLVATHDLGLRDPQAITVVDGQSFAIADRGNNSIVLVNSSSFGFHSRLPSAENVADGINSSLSQPNDVVVDGAGNLLVMDTGNERIAVFREDGTFVASVMQGFFKDHGNTYSYLYYNHLTGAIAVSNNDEHCVSIFSPIFEHGSQDLQSSEPALLPNYVLN